jgi:hypothetical protein
MDLMDHQKDAVKKLSNGKVLWGGVGSGKSRTAMAYYMEKEAPRHIYVITTARKRDSLDWEGEAAKFGVGTEDYGTVAGIITVDSWNNIKNYTDIEDAFFIFDEQRLVSYGVWVKSFLKIAKKNHWIMLSATPGDSWLDYAPLFIANGLYKNITAFKFEHVLYEPFSKYPKIKGYLNERKLEILRNDILVEMPFIRETTRYVNWLDVDYNFDLFKRVYRDRWHIYEDRPLKDAAELFRVMRKLVNSDESRLDTVLGLMKIHPRLIIFYNFDYELEILRTLELQTPVYEWNGHKKDPLPDVDKWVYLVQYVAGAEAWNCVTTDAMVFYSMTYSYKNFEQSQGRIDRLDTKFRSLYYYVLVSNSIIDRGIKLSLEKKEDFNESKFMHDIGEDGNFSKEPREIAQI